MGLKAPFFQEGFSLIFPENLGLNPPRFPDLPFLAFFGFPCFFRCKEFPCFFERFPILEEDQKGYPQKGYP